MTYQQAFCVVPYRILNLPGLTIQLLKFYETIFQFWHHGKDCFLKNDVLKERTGMQSDSTISDAFQYFEGHGEMKREMRKGKRFIVQCTPGSVEIESVDNSKDSSTNNSQGLATARGGSRYSEGEGLATARHNNNNINNNNLIKNICASKNDAQQSNFDIFWKSYPRKQDKKDAERIWKRDKLDLKFNEIMQKLAKQILNETQWSNKKHIPMPSTYLNGQRWNDEIINDQNNNNKSQKLETRSTVQWFNENH